MCTLVLFNCYPDPHTYQFERNVADKNDEIFHRKERRQKICLSTRLEYRSTSEIHAADDRDWKSTDVRKLKVRDFHLSILFNKLLKFQQLMIATIEVLAY